MQQNEKNKELTNFIKSFGNTYDGQGCEANYAKFTGLDRSTVNRIINGKIEPSPLHFRLMELCNERNELKRQIRKLKK